MAVDDSEYTTRIAQEVSTLVGNEAVNEGAATREQLFTQWCAELLEEGDFIGDFQAAEWRLQPPGRSAPQAKIDGFEIDVEDRYAAIFVAEWEPEMHRIPAAHIERLAAAGIEFIRASIDTSDPLHRRLESSQSYASFSRQLWENRDEIQRLKVFVLTNAVAATTEIPPRLVGDLPLEIAVWDARRLVRLVQEGDAPEAITIDLLKALGAPLPCIKAPTTDDRYEGFLAVMPAAALATIYDQYGSRMLEQNVRVYLQLTGKVNKGIRKTLVQEPGAFFAYNNGLSATVQSVDYVESPDGGGAIRTLTGLQIVNGAQTTGSIHRAWREDKASLVRVNVPIKITQIRADARQEIGDRISSFANSQNSVKAADFSARNPFHVRIEEISRRVWTPSGTTHWYYERMRGQYHDELARLVPSQQKAFRTAHPPRQKLVKTDIATIVHLWELRPDLVTLGAQKNFTRFTSGWLADNDKDWQPDDAWFRVIVAKAILWSEVYSAVRRSDVVGYQSQVAAYLMCAVIDRFGPAIDLNAIWASQMISTPLISLVESWCKPLHAALTSTANGQDAGMWARKPQCWPAMRSALAETLPVPANLPEVTAAGAVVATVRSTSVDLSADREQRLKVAREVTSGRVMKRDEAIKELQVRFGIARLTNERRAELEGLLDDMTRLAFLDSDETDRNDRGLATVRALLRGGVRLEADLVKRVASEWLEVQRVGHRIREQIDALFVLAKRRKILAARAGAVSCPTPTFEDYDDATLDEVILEIVVRKNRIYARRAVVEAAVTGLGLVQQREATLLRIDQRLDALVVQGKLEVPSEGGLRLKAEP